MAQMMVVYILLFAGVLAYWCLYPQARTADVKRYMAVFVAAGVVLATFVLSGCSVDSDTTSFHARNPMVDAQATAIAQRAVDDAASAALLRQGIEQQVADEARKRDVELTAQQAALKDVDAKRDMELAQLQAQSDTEVKAQPAKLAGKATWYALSWTGAGVGVLVLCVGAAFAVVALLNKRATSYYPDSKGQYPLVTLRGFGWAVVHDASRQVGPGAVYHVPTIGDVVASRLRLAPASATYPTPEVSEQALLAVSSQSNAIAMTAARNRWPVLPAGFMARNLKLDLREPVAPYADQSQPDVAQLTAGAFLPSRVPLTGLLHGQAPSLSRLVLGVGAGPDGQLAPVTGDLNNMVHVLCAGASGWGKSQFMRTLVFQLATSSESCHLVLADMERVTFNAFGKSDRLMFPVVDNERDLAAVLQELAKELDRRKQLFAELPDVDSLTSYNARARDPLAPVVLAVDEATQFLGDGHVADGIKLLARRGRKYGIWLTLGGQTFSSRDVDTATSLQFSTRVQFRAPVKTASQTLVDSKDAKALECPGRAILVLPGRDPVTIQVPVIGYDDILAALSGGRPARAIPQVIDQPADDGLDARIRLMAGDGASKTDICRQLFGMTGGSAWYRVTKALEFASSTSTPGVEDGQNDLESE